MNFIFDVLAEAVTLLLVLICVGAIFVPMRIILTIVDSIIGRR